MAGQLRIVPSNKRPMEENFSMVAFPTLREVTVKSQSFGFVPKGLGLTAGQP